MATRSVRKTDITTDDGMTSAINQAFADFSQDGDVKKATVLSAMIGRGISIRSLRLREEQFRRQRSPKQKVASS